MPYIKKKPNGNWFVRVSGTDEQGDRIQPSSTHDTKREALEWGRNMEQKLQKGEYYENRDITVKDWLEEWIERKQEKGLKRKTIERYEGLIRLHINPHFGDRELWSITPADVEEFYNEKKQTGRADGQDGGLSPSSINQIHAVLRGAYKEARKQNLVGTNPAEAVKPPKRTPQRTRRTLDHEQAQKFKKVAYKHSEYWIAYFLALDLGARMGEILALKWSDVDFEEGTIRIERALKEYSDGTLEFDTPKSDNSIRTISLDPPTQEALDQQKKHQHRQQNQWDGEWNPQNLICTRENGLPVRTSVLSEQMKRLVNRDELEDLPDLTFHELRHTCGTLMLKEATGEKYRTAKAISHRLGHSSFQFTMDTYVKYEAEDEREVTEGYTNKVRVDFPEDPKEGEA